MTRFMSRCVVFFPWRPCALFSVFLELDIVRFVSLLLSRLGMVFSCLPWSGYLTPLTLNCISPIHVKELLSFTERIFGRSSKGVSRLGPSLCNLSLQIYICSVFLVLHAPPLLSLRCRSSRSQMSHISFATMATGSESKFSLALFRLRDRCFSITGANGIPRGLSEDFCIESFLSAIPLPLFTSTFDDWESVRQLILNEDMCLEVLVEV